MFWNESDDVGVGDGGGGESDTGGDTRDHYHVNDYDVSHFL